MKTAANSTHLVLSSAPAAAATAVVDSAASAATTGQLPVADTVLRDDNQKLMVEVASLGQRLNAEARLLASQEVQLATLSRTTDNSSLFNDFPLLVSVGGNILLLLLFLWMLRRQKEAEQRQREISQRISTLSAAPKGASPQPQSPTPVLSAAPPPVVSPPASVQPAAVGAPVFDALPGLALSANHPEESAKDAYVGAEVDPLEQADLYLTYGKAEQAVSVLNESLEANPRRKELYVKLLDIYANLDRHEAYLDLAERMRGRFGPHNAVWQEVALQGHGFSPAMRSLPAPQRRRRQFPSLLLRYCCLLSLWKNLRHMLLWICWISTLTMPQWSRPQRQKKKHSRRRRKPGFCKTLTSSFG